MRQSQVQRTFARFYDFLCIPASAVDVSAANRNGIKTLLDNGLITFSINSNPVFSNGPRSLLRNSSDWIILDNLVFYNLISVDKWFSKSFQKQLVSVSFFIADFKL